MHPEWMTLPEFDRSQAYAIAAPVRWSRNRFALELFFEFLHGGIELRAIARGLRLIAGPRADLAFARPGGEIRVRIRVADLRNLALDAHLPAHRIPIEDQRRPGLGAKIFAL